MVSVPVLRTIVSSSFAGARKNLCRSFQKCILESKVQEEPLTNFCHYRTLRKISSSTSVLKPRRANSGKAASVPAELVVSTVKNDDRLITVEQVQKIAALFGMGNGKAKIIAKKYREIAEGEVRILKDRMVKLLERGLTMRRIRDLPWLLGISSDDLDDKLKEVMKSLGLDKDCSYAFLNLDEGALQIVKVDWINDKEKLRMYCQNPKNLWDNRISYVSETLGTSLTEAADMVSSGKLHSVPIERIHNHIVMLLEAGVQREDIVKDPWIFHMNNSHRFKQRIHLLHSHGVSPIKPWMLRADEGEFLIYVQKAVEEQTLLNGHNDLKGFLGYVLSCTPEDVDIILRREPSLKALRPKNIHEKIVFLQGLGYTTEDLIKSPRILTRCKNKLEKRYYELNELGYRPRISELYMTQMDYTNFLKSFLGRQC